MSDEKDKCRFTYGECLEQCYMYEILDPSLRMQYCLNCLLGKVIREIRLLSVRG